MGERARRQTLYFLGELREALAKRKVEMGRIPLSREVLKSPASKR